MLKSREEFQEKAGQEKADDTLICEIEGEVLREEKDGAADGEVTDEMLTSMTEEYHKNTGW